MYNTYRNGLTLSILTLWLIVACSGASAHEVAKHKIEALQKIKIAAAFDHSDYLYGNEIRISVYEGNVTLLGKVENAINRDLAKQIALGIRGINSVDNRIVVDAAYRSPKLVSHRSYTEMAAQMTLMPVNVGLSQANAAVSTHGKSMSSQPAGWGADTWVTARVKFALMYSGTIDSSTISVNTNDGIVTLNGRVSGGAERELAIEQTRNVVGVRYVDATDFKVVRNTDETAVAS